MAQAEKWSRIEQTQWCRKGGGAMYKSESNKIYDAVSLSIRKFHKIASIREDLEIIRASDNRTMHLNRDIEFRHLYANLPLHTSSRCCG